MNYPYSIYFLFCVVLTFSSVKATAQCSEVFIYRLNSAMQVTNPVKVYYEGSLLREFSLGERASIKICEPGVYEFVAKVTDEDSDLIKSRLTVRENEKHYLKVSANSINMMPLITNMKPQKGTRDLTNDRKFISDIYNLTLGGPEPRQQSSTNQLRNNPDFPEGSPLVQTVDNFQFEITKVEQYGSKGKLHLTIQNLDSYDRTLVMHNNMIMFIDDKGKAPYSRKACILGNCSDFKKGYGYSFPNDIQSEIDKYFEYYVYQQHKATLIPSGIPITATISVDDLDESVNILKRVSIWLYAYEGADYSNGHTFRVRYNGVSLKAAKEENEVIPINNGQDQEYILFDSLKVEAKSKDKVLGKKIILENIYFKSGSYQILPRSFQQLDELAQLLANNSYMRLEVSGHTDNVGDPNGNVILSDKRAASIRYYLIDKSIDIDRIETVGKGENEPIDTNETSEGRQKNRRVEIQVVE